MPLDPKTQEVWCGVRRIDSLVSELRQEIDALTGKLSGYKSYKTQLRNVDSFDSLDSALDKRVDETADLDTGDVDRTVTFLTNTFADFGTYKGDSNSGALSLTTYDDYRSYLINDNGASAVDADQHIQLLKDLFDPTRSFEADQGEHSTFDGFETELESNGVAASTAATVADLLASVYPTIAPFDRLVTRSSSYSEVDTGLTNAGLTASEADDVVAALKTAYGTPLDAGARDSFSAFDSFAEFEDYLLNEVGLSQERASSFIDKLQDEFTGFDAVRQALADAESLEAFLADFSHGSQSGSQDTPSGIKVFEDAGTDLDGTQMPEGAVSIRARGKINNVGIQADEVDETVETQTVIEWRDLQIDNTLPQVATEITATAEVENTSQSPGQVEARLIVDGQAVASRSIRLDGNTTRRVALRYGFAEPGAYEVGINRTSTQTVRVQPPTGL